MPMIAGKVVTDEMMIDEVRRRMRCKGYRPIRETDLVPGQELAHVAIETYYLSGAGLPPIGMAGTTVIKLDDPAVAPSNADDHHPVVFYHCTNPKWDGDCFVPLSSFIADEYILHGCYDNESRFFAKI